MIQVGHVEIYAYKSLCDFLYWRALEGFHNENYFPSMLTQVSNHSTPGADARGL